MIRKAIKLAYDSSRKTSWEAGPLYDHNEQRLHRDTIYEQLKDQFLTARTRTALMLTEWALTGKWSRFNNAPPYFVREILIWSYNREYIKEIDDFPDHPPPWKSKHVAEFMDTTYYNWTRWGFKEWINKLTDESYEFQESQWEGRFPYT